MPPINFKANFIRNTNIQQVINNSYVAKQVALVELDTKDKNDISALKTVADKWENKTQGYTRCIYYDATKDFKFSDTTEHYYAITLQNKNHKYLQPENILGLALFSKHNNGSTNELKWLQVNPDTNYNNKPKPNNRFFKNIGRSLVNFIKEVSDKTINVYSDADAIDFYEKLGFIHKKGKSMSMYFPK